MSKEQVHITLDDKVIKEVKKRKDTEGFCLSRVVNAYLMGLFKVG